MAGRNRMTIVSTSPTSHTRFSQRGGFCGVGWGGSFGGPDLAGVLTSATHDAKPSTSITASVNAWGASCGRLCPTPPSIVRCVYLPENLAAYALGWGCGAPLASPSSVIV